MIKTSDDKLLTWSKLQPASQRSLNVLASLYEIDLFPIPIDDVNPLYFFDTLSSSYIAAAIYHAAGLGSYF